jgi:hypothetical protein
MAEVNLSEPQFTRLPPVKPNDANPYDAKPLSLDESASLEAEALTSIEETAQVSRRRSAALCEKSR